MHFEQSFIRVKKRQRETDQVTDLGLVFKGFWQVKVNHVSAKML